MTAFNSGGRILVPFLARTRTKSIQFLKPRTVRKSSSPPFKVLEGVPSEKFVKKGEKDRSKEGQTFDLTLVGSVTVSLRSEEASCGVDGEINNNIKGVLPINKAKGAFILMEYIKFSEVSSYSQKRGTRTILITSIETAISSPTPRIRIGKGWTLESFNYAGLATYASSVGVGN